MGYQAAVQHGLCFHQSGAITKPWITFIEHIFGLWHESLIRYIPIATMELSMTDRNSAMQSLNNTSGIQLERNGKERGPKKKTQHFAFVVLSALFDWQVDNIMVWQWEPVKKKMVCFLLLSLIINRGADGPKLPQPWSFPEKRTWLRCKTSDSREFLRGAGQTARLLSGGMPSQQHVLCFI